VVTLVPLPADPVLEELELATVLPPLPPLPLEVVLLLAVVVGDPDPSSPHPVKPQATSRLKVESVRPVFRITVSCSSGTIHAGTGAAGMRSSPKSVSVGCS